MSSMGSRRMQRWKLGDKRFERTEVRRQLADAQTALAQAIQDRDPDTIAEARRAQADALQRLRDLT
jgi:hypothetical protein